MDIRHVPEIFAKVMGDDVANITLVWGNLITKALDGEFDAIVHGCNCFCAMGAGIAKQIAAVFPAALAADLSTIRGDRNKLGSFTKAKIGELLVYNAYTQYNYGGAVVNADYNAIENSLRLIREESSGKRIGLPLIGCGLAGGDVETVLNIIKKVFSDDEHQELNPDFVMPEVTLVLL